MFRRSVTPARLSCDLYLHAAQNCKKSCGRSEFFKDESGFYFCRFVIGSIGCCVIIFNRTISASNAVVLAHFKLDEQQNCQLSPMHTWKIYSQLRYENSYTSATNNKRLKAEELYEHTDKNHKLGPLNF